MRARAVLGWLIMGVLLVSALGQDNTGVQSTKGAIKRVQQQSGAAGVSRDVESNDPQRIVVDVWSSAPSSGAATAGTEPGELSEHFAVAALTVTSRMQVTERQIENSIKNGFPLGESWIQSDLDAIDDSLNLAALSTTNYADAEALQQLQHQADGLRLWSNWLIDANRKMELGEYFVSPEPLQKDERFQNTVACTRFLASMLVTRKLGEDSACL